MNLKLHYPAASKQAYLVVNSCQGCSSFTADMNLQLVPPIIYYLERISWVRSSVTDIGGIYIWVEWWLLMLVPNIRRLEPTKVTLLRLEIQCLNHHRRIPSQNCLIHQIKEKPKRLLVFIWRVLNSFSEMNELTFLFWWLEKQLYFTLPQDLFSFDVSWIHIRIRIKNRQTY